MTYTPSGNPGTGAEGLSAVMRAEFASIGTAFSLLPPFTATGVFSTIFAQQGNFTFTLPPAAGTLATTANVATEAGIRAAADAQEATTRAAADAQLAPKTSPAIAGTAVARKALLSTSGSAAPAWSTETYAVPGTAGNVMISDGTNWTSGLLGLTYLSAVTMQTFLTSGTYTPTARTKFAIVKIRAGGGAGGLSGGLGLAGSGGGEGEYAEGVFTATQIGASQAVTVGAGANFPGTTGGTTSFGSLLTAVGGPGGNTSGTGVAGGTGGTGTGIHIAGAGSDNSQASSNFGSMGGGGGGRGGNTTPGDHAGNAFKYGSGGGGAGGPSSGGSPGNGAQGYVEIIEFS
jgi:hypothetical protein